MSYSIFAKEYKCENWDNFVILCDQFSEVIAELISKKKFEQTIPEDVKKVACYKLKNDAAFWFLLKSPILDGERPVDLLDKYEGLTAITEILLRIPS